MPGGWSLHAEEGFDSAEKTDVAGQMRTQLFGDAWTQVDVVAEVVDA
jgi:hypothetical protein